MPRNFRLSYFHKDSQVISVIVKAFLKRAAEITAMAAAILLEVASLEFHTWGCDPNEKKFAAPLLL